MAKALPDGYNSVQPYLVVSGASKQIDFLMQAFGGRERMRMDGPGGTVAHAEVEIGNSVIMVGDAGPQNPAMPACVMLYVDDVDGTYKKALAAGAKSEREPENMFYGDRASTVIDAFGNRWFIHTHIEDVAPEEMEKRAATAMSQS
jgi:PhnB protein